MEVDHMAQLDSGESSKTYRGTVDEVFSHRNEIPAGSTVELRVLPDTPKSDEDPNPFGDKSLAELFEEIGAVEGLPADLSTNPAYKEGFGELSDRRTLQS